MKQKLKIFWTVWCLCCLLLIPRELSAASGYVYDYADLLTTEEEEILQQCAQKYKNNWDMNFLVVTTADAEGKSAMEYADDFYDKCFPKDSEEDGILYLIDMDNREIYLSTCGSAIRYLTDVRIDAILDNAFDCVESEDYYGTFLAFFEETGEYLKQGMPSDQYHYDTETGNVDAYDDIYEKPTGLTFYEVLLALVCAILAAVGTCVVIVGKYQLKFEDFHYDAYTDSEVKLSVKSDRLVNRFVTHRRIPRNQGSSGGGSSGGSRSSIHRSSGGRSHGGGGRGF